MPIVTESANPFLTSEVVELGTPKERMETLGTEISVVSQEVITPCMGGGEPNISKREALIQYMRKRREQSIQGSRDSKKFSKQIDGALWRNGG